MTISDHGERGEWGSFDFFSSLDIQYHIRFAIAKLPLEEFTAESMVVRVASGDRAGVKFTGISKGDRDRVTELCNG